MSGSSAAGIILAAESIPYLADAFPDSFKARGQFIFARVDVRALTVKLSEFYIRLPIYACDGPII